MQSIGAFQAKAHFSALLDQVENGEHIIITKYGHPVAKLIPITDVDSETTKQAIQQLKEFCLENTLSDIDWKTLRDEGQK